MMGSLILPLRMLPIQQSNREKMWIFQHVLSKNIEPRSMLHVTLARFLVGDEKRSAVDILEYLFSNFSEKPYTKNDDQNSSKDSCHSLCHDFKCNNDI